MLYPRVNVPWHGATMSTMSRFCQELPVHPLDGLETPVFYVAVEEGSL